MTRASVAGGALLLMATVSLAIAVAASGALGPARGASPSVSAAPSTSAVAVGAAGGSAVAASGASDEQAGTSPTVAPSSTAELGTLPPTAVATPGATGSARPTGTRSPPTGTPASSTVAPSSSGGVPSPATPASASPPVRPSVTASGSPTPGPTASASAVAPAPTSPVGFQPRHTVVPILFPLPATVAWTYGDGWRVPRVGTVYPYNQISRVAPDGTLVRGHDGVDIRVPIGTPVLAPFSGVVVNPAAIWKPWQPARYGNVVAIRSSESTSRGYYTILVHLSRVDVKVGTVVQRGEVVGLTGITGNAAGTIPHLHFELRMPFQFVFHYAGVARSLDSFDPLPSLLAADPHRH